MNTTNGVKQILAEHLARALECPTTNEKVINDLCAMLDKITRRIER